MTQTATDFIPANPGQNLGSQNQPWNAFLSVLNNGTPVNLSVVANVFVSSPAFISTSAISIQTMPLTGNVGASTYTGPVGLVVFQFTQDSVGGRTFVWPTTFNGGTTIQTDPNQVTSQLFYFDGVHGWPIGAGVTFP